MAAVVFRKAMPSARPHTIGLTDRRNATIAISLFDDAETQFLAESFRAARLLNKSTLATTLIDELPAF